LRPQTTVSPTLTAGNIGSRFGRVESFKDFLYMESAKWGSRISVQPLTNSMALVLERTILTERLPLVGEVTANFFGLRWSMRRIPNGRNLDFLDRTSLGRSYKLIH
jgi:hypothetical protein